MYSILITGANSGIGLSTFTKSLDQSYFPIAAVRNPELMQQELDSKAIDPNKYLILPCDMKSTESIYELINKLKKNRIKVDYTVLNAAIINTSAALMTTIQSIDEHIQVNFTNQILLAQLIIKSFLLKKKSGGIVAISSSAAIDANPGRLAYASSKAALSTGIRVLSKEFGHLNIRCNVIAPGLTDTKLMHNSTEADQINKFVETISARRIGKPDEIANLILYLCSPNSSYINGEVISCDGGIR